MKRLLIVVFVSLLSMTLYAQQKKVAVYVTGPDAAINKVLGSKFTNALGKKRDYSVIERSEEFLAQIMKEQSYQRTGMVDDEEIARLGMQFGVSLVCVVNVDKAFNVPYVTARIIDVETAEVEGATSYTGALASADDVMNAGNSLVQGLFASMSSEKILAWKKVAVYVAQTEASKDFAYVLGDKLVAGFTENGRYIAIERTNSFLSQLSAEQTYQRTGAVDNQSISRLGKQFGVQYVCVANVTDLFGEKYISSRIIDVETAEVVKTFEISGSIENIEECSNMAKQIADALSKPDKNHYSMNVVDFRIMSKPTEPIVIPEWFMNIKEGTYVGITMPNGYEIDAIGMALIQKIMASDEYLNYSSFHQDTIIDYGRKRGVESYSRSTVTISTDIDVHYNIQELTELPSGEFVCRITDGNRNRMRVKLEYDFLSEDFMAKHSQEREITKLIKVMYGNRESNMQTQEFWKNDTMQYRSYWSYQDSNNEYRFINEVESVNGKDNAMKQLYSFPDSQSHTNSNAVRHSFPINTKKCLAEQLWDYYMDIMIQSLPTNRNNSFYMRKKTPIVNQEYENGQFIINCSETK